MFTEISHFQPLEQIMASILHNKKRFNRRFS